MKEGLKQKEGKSFNGECQESLLWKGNIKLRSWAIRKCLTKFLPQEKDTHSQ